MRVNEKLAQELYKPVIKKFKGRKLYARFKIKFGQQIQLYKIIILFCGVQFLLCVINVFTKYAWVKHLKGKKAETVLHGFIEIVNESNRKLNGLIKEKSFIIDLCKNDQMILIF